MRNRKLLVLVIPSVLLFCLVLGICLIAKKYGKGQRVRTAGQIALLKHWQAEEFAEISPQVEFSNNIIRNIRLQPSGKDLDKVQTDALFDAIYNLALSYNLGSYSAYLKFRDPLGSGEYKSNVIQFELEQLQKFTNNLHSLSVSEPKSVQEAWWDYWRKNNAGICTQCWKKVGRTSSYVEITKGPQLPENIQDTAWKYINQLAARGDSLGVLTMNPSLITKPTPADILKEGEIVCATVFLNIKSSDDPVYPVFCRFYWSGNGGKWVPMEFAALYAQERKFSVLF